MSLMNILRVFVGIAFLIVVSAVVVGQLNARTQIAQEKMAFVTSKVMEQQVASVFDEKRVARILQEKMFEPAIAKGEMTKDQAENLFTLILKAVPDAKTLAAENMGKHVANYFPQETLPAMTELFNAPQGVSAIAKFENLRPYFDEAKDSGVLPAKAKEVLKAEFSSQEQKAIDLMAQAAGGYGFMSKLDELRNDYGAVSLEVMEGVLKAQAVKATIGLKG